MAPLPPRNQRHAWIQFEDKEYTDEIFQDFEDRLGRIFGRQVHKLQVLDFGSLSEEMDQSITDRLRIYHIWGDSEFILALGLHYDEEIDIDGIIAYWDESSRVIAFEADLIDY
nr:hypothetical protein [Tanacetum cinerariifolium]